MKVRIGVADTDKVLEVEVDDPKDFKKEIDRSVSSGGMAWFTDSKGRTVGVSAKNVAFVEIDDAEQATRVGFAAL